MKILVINGPNINMLGIREPEHYGKETYADLVAKIQKHCASKNVDVKIYYLFGIVECLRLLNSVETAF